MLKSLPFEPYLKSPEQSGQHAIIQQGKDPVLGFTSGKPCDNFKNTVIFGDHNKPQKPFFIATDGIRILQDVENMNGNYLFSLLERNLPKSEGYKRYYSILSDKEVSYSKNEHEQI